MGACLGHCFQSSRKYNRCKTHYFCRKDIVEFQCLVENEPSSKKFALMHSFSSLLCHNTKKKALPKKVAIELVEDSWANCYNDDLISSHRLSSHVPLHHLESILGRSCDHNGGLHSLDPREFMSVHPHSSFNVSLDHNSLLSTPPSSIDLEWEHEEPFYADHLQDASQSHGGGNDLVSLVTRSCTRKGQQHIVNHVTRIQTTSTRQNSLTNDSSSGSKDQSRITTPDSLEWDFVETAPPSVDKETEQLIAEIELLAARALEETGEHLQNLENLTIDEDS